MFKKYIHIEDISSDNVEGILEDTCIVMPKLDGVNASIWWDGRKLCCGSRFKQLDEDNTLQGFYNWVQKNKVKLEYFFSHYSEHTLYGEWLVSNTVKSYHDECWKDFYIFDVMLEDKFLDYEEFQYVLDKYELTSIPIIAKGTEFNFQELLKDCRWLLKDDESLHEGLVIKRYNFRNKFGNRRYAKYVPVNLQELRKQEKRTERNLTKPNDYQDNIEFHIIDQYLTDHLINKELEKIKLERGFSNLDNKMIGQALGTIWHCLIIEEMWDILKKFKNPKIDFSVLKKLSDEKVKLKFDEVN